MDIYPNQTEAVCPEVSRPTSADAANGGGVVGVLPGGPNSDRFETASISAAGRVLAARGACADMSAVDPARADRFRDRVLIRDRVLSGAYDTLEVVDAVARRLLASGDL
jgi:hypothetical protein